MAILWSCKGCSHYEEGKGCTKESGCDYISAMVRLERILSEEFHGHGPERPPTGETEKRRETLRR